MASRSLPEVQGFTVQRVLGRGGFATVYLATQDRLRRDVALKVIHLDAADASARRRFVRECETIALLTGHPSVMTVFDVGTTKNGDPYLALEYLSGGSVHDRLAEHGPAPWNEAVEIGRAVAAALGAAHDVGILHRDVKPANVLMDRFGHYKLGDFGIARLVGPSSQTTRGATTLTVAYASPEVLRGEASSTASDLYGLGALMYAVLTGGPAFTSPTDESVLPVILRITTDDLPPLPAGIAPPDVSNLVERLMSKDPAARPSSAQEVIDVLTAAAAMPDPAELNPPESLQPTVALPDRTLPPVSPTDTVVPDPTQIAPSAVAEPGAGAGLPSPHISPSPTPDATWVPGDPGGHADTPVPPRPGAKWRELAIVATIAVVGLAVMGAALAFGLTRGDASPDSVEVLDYVGRDEDEARDALEGEGFDVSSNPVDSEEREGTVVEIHPDPGSRLPEGAVVIIDVSNGEGTGGTGTTDPGTTEG